ncbi:Haem-NO-binding [Rhodovulum sp. ES.010]|uniref:heme NO-binding domain-containing protein n=1 Tax=Rhodovulum sp. ES.010 TaxID=1882821 RepID=UPI000928B418|nr:heme NO-binding domain-containing protein [Rhodovulum sp. ES.010]SIO57335.1 Haem-NO-binding [Rhodovulum sp. ES.010]
MQGLINRAIECFLRDTYGNDSWACVARAAGADPGGFEPMMTYDDSVTEALIAAACRQVDVPRDMLLEDLGTFLVSGGSLEAVRRLMRFGGETFEEFLFSLDDLPDRVRLAVPDLHLPDLELAEGADSGYRLFCLGGWPGVELVLLGMLRAMADDYGALAVLDLVDRAPGRATLKIALLDARFHEGRSFSLAVQG